jgi:hypothetical protein
MADRRTDRRAEVERMNPPPSLSTPRHKINHQSPATWSFERREKEQEEEKMYVYVLYIYIYMKGNQSLCKAYTLKLLSVLQKLASS